MARYHVRQIALDGNDLDAMIEFWAAALGYELDHRHGNYAILRDPGGAEPRLFLPKSARSYLMIFKKLTLSRQPGQRALDQPLSGLKAR